MQRPLTRLSARCLPACGYVVHPTGLSVSQSMRVVALRKHYFVGVQESVLSVLLNSHRNYVRGVDSSGARPRNGTNNDAIALNKKIVKLGKNLNWREILQLVETEKSRFDNVNWATAFSQLGKIRNLDRHDPRFESFVNEYAACLESRGLQWAGIRGVANVVYAIGKMRLKNAATNSILEFISKPENARMIVQEGEEQAASSIAWAVAELDDNAFTLNTKMVDFGKEGKWKEILFLVEKDKNRFDNVNWATAFSQLGRIRTLDRRDPLFKSFVHEYAGCIESRGLQWAGVLGVVSVVHIIGRMDLKNSDTKRILAFASEKENACKIVQEGNAQMVGNVAWAFAKLGVSSPELFVEIENRADWLVTNGTPQNIANVAGAFAKLRVKSPKLFGAIDVLADWLVLNGTPQEVANTAWAYAKLGVKLPVLFSEIEKHADWLVGEGNPQEVANTAWACAKLGVKSPELFAKIETRADWLVTKGTTQEVANTAWACAKLGFRSPELFAEIENHADWLVTSGNTQEVSITVWACATLGINSPKLFAATERRANWLITNGRPQAIRNLAWAFATLGIESSKFSAAVKRINEGQ